MPNRPPIKTAAALIYCLALLSLVAGCGRRGPLELPPGAQASPQADEAARALSTDPAAANTPNFVPPGPSGADAQAAAAPASASSAAAKPKRTFFLDPIL